MAHLDNLVASHELTRAKARYCLLLDTRDWAALAGLLTEDVEFRLEDDGPALSGRDAVLAVLRAALADSRSVHQATMPLIDVDGDEARCVWTVHDEMAWDDGRRRSRYSHHRDRWLRERGEWRLAALRATRLIVHSDPSAPLTMYEAVRRATGRMDDDALWSAIRSTADR